MTTERTLKLTAGFPCEGSKLLHKAIYFGFDGKSEEPHLM